MSLVQFLMASLEFFIDIMLPTTALNIGHCMLDLPNYLLVPWSRVLLEKLTGLQLVKKFPAFYGTRRFTTALTSARHLSLSWASSIQSTHPHPTSWRSILIPSSHLRLGLPSGLLPSGFPTHQTSKFVRFVLKLVKGSLWHLMYAGRWIAHCMHCPVI